MKLIIPDRLKKGDTVGIIAPCEATGNSDFMKSRTGNGVAFLESLGLKVKFAPHVHDEEYFGGATIENRIKDIHDMFLDPEVKMVMMIVGGFFTNLIIDKLDYELIRNNPKIFIGFSDGTLLTNSIYKNSCLQTYYGINLSDSIGFNISQEIKDNFYQTFFTSNDIIINENKNLISTKWWGIGKGKEKIGYDGWNVVKKGKCKGILTGGLLDRLIMTDYGGVNVNYKDRILFFETISNLKNLLIFITSMKQKGVFNQIKGMIVGYCHSIEDQKEVADLLKELLKEYDFPILQIGELGHNVENYVFPIGAEAEIDTDKMEIIIKR